MLLCFERKKYNGTTTSSACSMVNYRKTCIILSPNSMSNHSSYKLRCLGTLRRQEVAAGGGDRRGDQYQNSRGCDRQVRCRKEGPHQRCGRFWVWKTRDDLKKSSKNRGYKAGLRVCHIGDCALHCVLGLQDVTILPSKREGHTTCVYSTSQVALPS